MPMTANYAYTDGKITKTAMLLDRRQIAGTSKHIANAWLNYDSEWCQNVLMSAGVQYAPGVPTGMFL
jgi:outer membrane receptor protein involved in Fe transport